MSAISPNDGPLIWLTACAHGDEVAGIVIIQEIFKKLKKGLLRGQVHAFPLMNPLGFENASRSISLSSEDLNRSFPGNPAGTLGERIAHQIFDAVTSTDPDLVIDLHNDWIRSIPYALLDRKTGIPDVMAWEKSAESARDSGFCVIMDPEEIRKSLSYNFLARGIPALTLEMGEPFMVNEINVRHGIGAVWNILASMNMVQNTKEPFVFPVPEGFAGGRILDYLDRPVCSSSGVIRYIARPGTVVRKGQNLARIVNAFGKTQEILTASQEALVLGHNDMSAAFPGMPLMAFGIRGEK
jgi:hypothetical protein